MRNKDFFKEEIRCDHLVTENVKKLWDVQMGCLDELKRICDKHRIKYFATGGTLLGAIRHKGYIPWDDDLDVAMLMDDYIKFLEVAKKEIKAPYFFQSYETESGFGPSLSRIRNTETTACTEFEYNRYSEDYNFGVFIDIFPISGLAPMGKNLWIQKTKVFFWRSILAGYEADLKIKIGLEKTSVKDYLLKAIWTITKPLTSHKQVSMHFLKACNFEGSNRVGLISFMGFNNRYIWDSNCFEQTIQVPFEDIMMIIPKDYDNLLKHTYGDYNVFVKGASIHSMKMFDPEHPYTRILKDRIK